MMRNLSVIACNETDGFYYPGFVSQSLDDGTVWVRFYDIKPNRVAREDIIHIGGAVPCPELQVGDYVLVRVMCRTMRTEYYVPAAVLVLPRGQAHDTKFYTLQLYNGRFIDKLRRNIVKIGPERFKAIFKYIAELRYGQLTRTVTLESLSSRESVEQLKKSNSSSPHLVLYPDNTERISIYRLHDGSRDKYRIKEISKISYVLANSADPDETLAYVAFHLAPSERYLRRIWKHTRYENRLKKENRIVSKYVESGQHKDVRKDHSVSEGKSSRSLEEDPDTPHVTSYSDDTDTTSAIAKKDTLKGSCDTLRSVETIASETENSKKNSRGETPSKRHRKKKSKRRGKANDNVPEKKESKKPPPGRRSSSSSQTSVTSRTFAPPRVLEMGQEVLARWSDDGWYYVGVILKPDGDDRYYVGDSTGYIESILTEDLIGDINSEFKVIQPSDHVIALHPNYVFSYAPATVKEVYAHGVGVMFFDKTNHKLPYTEVYKISANKYNKDTKYIVETENHLRKSPAIARNDRSGVYQQCEIVCPEGIGQKFIMKWQNGELASQTGNHIFSVNSRNQSEQKIDWDYVLAPLDDSLLYYLPAEVIQTNPFRVKILNQSRLTECCLHQCFWINEFYYNNAVNFCYNISHSDRHMDKTPAYVNMNENAFYSGTSFYHKPYPSRHKTLKQRINKDAT